MRLHDLPAGELPRERLIAQGTAALSDAELLAVLLRTGRAGENVLELARGIVARFRETGLSAILSMPCAEFARIPGIGAAKAATVLAALELGRRAQQRTDGTPRIHAAADAAQILIPRCAGLRQEHFYVLPLSAKKIASSTALQPLTEPSTGTRIFLILPIIIPPNHSFL